jgi:hypothetical protein
MKFTTPCFVRVKDMEERKKLIEWLKDIGRIERFYIEDDGTPVYGDIIVVNKGISFIEVNDYWLYAATESEYPNKCIDCGTNMPLFKALAAMNDENGNEQWFIDENEWAKKRELSGGEVQWLYIGYLPLNTKPNFSSMRKAIAEEIIQHFKNQKS